MRPQPASPFYGDDHLRQAPQQLTDLIESALTADFERTVCRQLIKVFSVIPIGKG